MSTSIERLEKHLQNTRERLRRAEEQQSAIEELQAANRCLLLSASEIEADIKSLRQELRIEVSTPAGAVIAEELPQ